MIVSLGSIFITAAYLILIELFFKGWNKLKDFNPSDVPSEIKASVVICCKNESQNLPALIDSLKRQSYTDFELVLVDDNSTDHSFELMNDLTSQMNNVRIIRSLGVGKKAALIQAVNTSSGNIILTTDADCILPTEWVQTVLSYHAENKPDLLLAPVVIRSDGSYFQDLQRLEFASLVASGAGAVGAKLPILANGANLSFTRNTFIQSIDDLKIDIPSGDDIFLLYAVKKRMGKIEFLRAESAVVETEACPDLRGFVSQRKRWASKSSALRDYQQIFIILVIVGISLFEVFAFISGLIRPYFWVYLMMMFVAKLTADYILLAKVNPFFKNRNLLLNSFVISIVYPVYVLYTTISSFKISYLKL